MNKLVLVIDYSVVKIKVLFYFMKISQPSVFQHETQLFCFVFTYEVDSDTAMKLFFFLLLVVRILQHLFQNVL